MLLMKKDEERKDEEYIEMVEEIWRTRRGIIRQNEEQINRLSGEGRR